MELLFGGFFLYVAFLILTLSVVLISLHIRFFIAHLKKGGTAEDVGYCAFLKKMFSRRNRLMIFIFIPLGLTIAILGPTSIAGPYQAARFRSELQDSTLLKIRTGGFCHRIPEREVHVYETDDIDEIKELLSRLSFRPTMAGIHCMCCGELSFEFYKNDEIAGAFSLHHDTHIRIQNRSLGGDVYLTGGSCKLLDVWLSEKGVRKIQEEIDMRRAEELKIQAEEWEKKLKEEAEIPKT